MPASRKGQRNSRMAFTSFTSTSQILRASNQQKLNHIESQLGKVVFSFPASAIQKGTLKGRWSEYLDSQLTLSTMQVLQIAVAAACCCEVTSVVSDSVRPHRWQSTRLCHPWDSPGKNTGVGCHFLLQCTKVKSQREAAQSCPTLCNPMGCSLPGASIHGIFQARVLQVDFPLFPSPLSFCLPLQQRLKR